MAQNFLSCDREQELLFPPSLREWLADDHLAWFVVEVVDELDLTAFYGVYRQDGHGRAAHDPAMMVALLVYAYAIGVRSSRAIERRCREDVAFRVIAANQAPDHATIARFRARHERAIAELFGGVLELCAQAGLVELGVVVVDGTRIAASAADRQTRSYEQIAKEMLGEAAALDAAEDALYGEERGDELPPGFRNSGDRRTRLREAKQALEAQRAAQAKKVPRDRRQRLHECRRRLYEDWALERRVVADHAAWLAAGIASDGSRRMTGAGRRRRRRLLENRSDRSARRPGHPDARRAGCRPAQRPQPDATRRPLRLHAPRPCLRPRGPALHTPPSDHRARVRPDQAQPRRRALPTPRPLGRQIRMAAAGRHPQHPQALAPQHRRRGRLTAARRGPHDLTNRPSTDRLSTGRTFAQQPPWKAVAAATSRAQLAGGDRTLPGVQSGPSKRGAPARCQREGVGRDSTGLGPGQYEGA
jgi:transposase